MNAVIPPALGRRLVLSLLGYRYVDGRWWLGRERLTEEQLDTMSERRWRAFVLISPCARHADGDGREITWSHAEVRCADCDALLSTTRCSDCGHWLVTGPHELMWDDALLCVPCFEKRYGAEETAEAPAEPQP